MSYSPRAPSAMTSAGPADVHLAQQEARLSQDRLAATQRRGALGEQPAGALVVGVVGRQERHERTRIQEHARRVHSPKPWRCLRLADRSRGPALNRPTLRPARSRALRRRCSCWATRCRPHNRYELCYTWTVIGLRARFLEPWSCRNTERATPVAIESSGSVTCSARRRRRRNRLEAPPACIAGWRFQPPGSLPKTPRMRTATATPGSERFDPG